MSGSAFATMQSAGAGGGALFLVKLVAGSLGAVPLATTMVMKRLKNSRDHK